MKRLGWVAGFCVVAAGASHAQTVVWDFQGTGEVCTSPAGGGAFVCETDRQFTGTITLELLAPAPAGPDGFIEEHRAWDDNGWVRSDFTIRWDDKSFTPGPSGDIVRELSRAEVWDNYMPSQDETWQDMLDLTSSYANAVCHEVAGFTRSTPDQSWLDGLDFDLTAGLAPGANATNVMGFETTCDPSFYMRYGRIQVTSMTPHSAQVRIDVRPHVEPNYIDPGSPAIVPVAVLGSDQFDATQVDPAHTTFGPGGAEPVGHVRISDVNRDGFEDAVLLFRIREAGIRYGEHSVTLHGTTYSGAEFSGEDRIRTTGHRGHPPRCDTDPVRKKKKGG